MLIELLTRDVREMNPMEMELECLELEDFYTEALKDNAGFDILTIIWRRIQELRQASEQFYFEKQNPY